MTPTPPNTPINAAVLAFWVDQLAGQPLVAREGWLSALAASHGVRFAECVRELLAEAVAA